MMEIDDELVREFLEDTLPSIFSEFASEELDFDPDQLDIDIAIKAITSPQQRYQLPNHLIMPYLVDLTRVSTTDAQWLLGRSLFQQTTLPIAKAISRGGRTTEIFDRIFICCFVEWCLEVHEMGRSDAYATAEDLFDVSAAKLRRWYQGGKGAASGERRLARELIRLLPKIDALVEEHF